MRTNMGWYGGAGLSPEIGSEESLRLGRRESTGAGKLMKLTDRGAAIRSYYAEQLNEMKYL